MATKSKEVKRAVVVRTKAGERVNLLPGDKVPDGVEITNPKVFEEPEDHAETRARRTSPRRRPPIGQGAPPAAKEAAKKAAAKAEDSDS